MLVCLKMLLWHKKPMGVAIMHTVTHGCYILSVRAADVVASVLMKELVDVAFFSNKQHCHER